MKFAASRPSNSEAGPTDGGTPNDTANVRWDLSDLYDDRDSLERDLDGADTEATVFAERYRGEIEQLDASELERMFAQYESILERINRAYSYAYLWWSTDTSDSERGALLQSVREANSRIRQKILFVETEWAELPEGHVEALLEQEELQEYRHFLEVRYMKRDHVLSESEETVLSEKSLTGRGAWSRFFDETVGSIRFTFRDEIHTQEELLSKLYMADRSVRRGAALSFTDGLEDHLRSFTYIFNTILADKASDDRLRNYPHWLASRNLDNEISDQMVEALVQSVTENYDLVARFYRLKQKLLGIDEMMDYDRYAPVETIDRTYTWSDATGIVLDAYHSFDSKMGEVASKFIEQNWVDAALEPRKRSGAFSARTVPSVHPYIMLNYTQKTRDVLTLAHELGHGVHQYLAREQGVLEADTPLTTAETASVFGEMLVFRRLLDRESDPQTRLTMLVQKIDDTIATVFRQIAMNRFEDRIHQSRRRSGELTTDSFCQHWMETQRAMFKRSVTLGDHYRFWWSYIPHFIHTPGYVYAYAFGELLVLALYRLYLEEGDAFVDNYRGVLRAGGSEWPDKLMGRLGVDTTDPTFWKQGLSAIDELIFEAEQLASSHNLYH